MSKKKNGKKELGILLGVVFAGILVFAVIQLFLSNAEDGGFSKTVPTISSSEFYSKLDSQEDFVMIYGSETCSACISYKPVVGSVLKDDSYKDIPVFYVEAEQLSADEKTTITEDLGIESTPTTFVVIDGEVEEKIEGSVDKSRVENIFDLYRDYK